MGEGRKMSQCAVLGFDCPAEDLCPHCRGTGEEPVLELCCYCQECFDEVIGWSTGIRPGSHTAKVAADVVAEGRR